MNLEIGSASYHAPNKAKFKRESLALLRKVAKILALEKGTYNIRYNPAGIACSGDATLHAVNFYVTFNLDVCDWILVRTCKGHDDYTGGPNRHYSFRELARDGAEGLAQFVRDVLGVD